jgi:hypothetical protein
MTTLIHLAQTDAIDLDNLIPSIKELLAGEKLSGDIELDENTTLRFVNGISY